MTALSGAVVKTGILREVQVHKGEIGMIVLDPPGKAAQSVAAVAARNAVARLGADHPLRRDAPPPSP